MRIRLLHALGDTAAGAVIEKDDRRAQALIAMGYAEPAPDADRPVKPQRART